MKELWRGVAIAGIWIGVGITGIFAGPAVMVVAICALFATLVCSD